MKCIDFSLNSMLFPIFAVDNCIDTLMLNQLHAAQEGNEAEERKFKHSLNGIVCGHHKNSLRDGKK